MSKARSMYAGSSGMINGANTMTVQFGNKLQGIAPTTNKSSHLITRIQTKAYGNNRNYLFCVNQLSGGVGRNNGQFTPASDGVNDCKEGDYTPSKIESANREAFNTLIARFINRLYIGTSRYISSNEDIITDLSSVNSSNILDDISTINDYVTATSTEKQLSELISVDDLSSTKEKLQLITDHFKTVMILIMLSETDLVDYSIISDVIYKYPELKDTEKTKNLNIGNIIPIIQFITKHPDISQNAKNILTLILNLLNSTYGQTVTETTFVDTMQKMFEIVKIIMELVLNKINSGLGGTDKPLRSLWDEYSSTIEQYSNVIMPFTNGPNRFKPTSNADFYIAIYYYFTGDLPDTVDDSTRWTQDDIDNFTSKYTYEKIGYCLSVTHHDDILDWNTVEITDMSYAFSTNNYSYSVQSNAKLIYNSIQNWYGSAVDVKRSDYTMEWSTGYVTNMSYMFYNANNFAASGLQKWNTSAVTNMSYMFYSAYEFNTDITSWDTSNVTDMSYMFKGTKQFDRDIGSWDVSSVTNMSYMFNGALWPSNGEQVSSNSFNNWDVSNVTDFSGMFYNASHVNLELYLWQVDAVTNMSETDQNTALYNMFYGATTMKSHYGDRTGYADTPDITFFNNTS